PSRFTVRSPPTSILPAAAVGLPFMSAPSLTGCPVFRGCASWVRDGDGRELRTTAVTLAEVRYGIARLPDGRRKQILLAAADELFSAFADQVLPVDTAVAEQYGVMSSSRERGG